MNNKITSLPPEICQLEKITHFYIDGNPLISPPYEIARLGIGAIREYFAELEKRALRILVGKGARVIQALNPGILYHLPR